MMKQYLQMIKDFSQSAGLFVIAGTFAFASGAGAYDVGETKVSGNVTTLSDIKLAQSVGAPAIHIGELTVTNVEDGEREGFITADEISLKNLELTYTLDGTNTTISVPDAYFENYDGPSFSKAQLENHDFTHPGWNWALLAFQMFADSVLYSEGLKVKVDSQNLEISAKMGKYELVDKNGRFYEVSESSNFKASFKINDKTINYSIKLGATTTEGQGDHKPLIMGFINPEAYPSVVVPVIEKSHIDHLVIKSDATGIGEILDINYQDWNRFNIKASALSMEDRKVIANIVKHFATHGLPKTKEDKQALVNIANKETLVRLLHAFLDISVEKDVVKSMTSSSNLNRGMQSLVTINNIETTQSRWLNFRQQTASNITYKIMENGAVFADIKVGNLDWQNVQLNDTIKALADHVIDGLLQGEGHMMMSMFAMVQTVSLDQIYPRFGNVTLSDIGINVPSEKLSFTIDEVSTTQADNQGMPDSGSFDIKHLVASASSLSSHMGPFAQILADDEGNIDLSFAMNWRADEAEGAYNLESVKAKLRQAVELDFLVSLGGFEQSWQSRPLFDTFNPFFGAKAGLTEVGLSIKDLGLHERLLSFAPLMTGMSVSEVKTMAKSSLEGVLDFAGSKEFTEPLVKAVGEFVDKGGMVSIVVKPKASDIFPFKDIQPALRKNMGKIEEVITYEATSSQ